MALRCVSGALSGGRVESFPRLETMTPSLVQVLAFPASGPTGQPGCYRQTAIIVQMAARGVAAVMRRIDGQPSSDVEVVGEQETCQILARGEGNWQRTNENQGLSLRSSMSFRS